MSRSEEGNGDPAFTFSIACTESCCQGNAVNPPGRVFWQRSLSVCVCVCGVCVNERQGGVEGKEGWSRLCLCCIEVGRAKEREREKIAIIPQWLSAAGILALGQLYLHWTTNQSLLFCQQKPRQKQSRIRNIHWHGNLFLFFPTTKYARKHSEMNIA